LGIVDWAQSPIPKIYKIIKYNNINNG